MKRLQAELLARLILRTWKWRRRFPPKRQLTFKEKDSVISHTKVFLSIFVFHWYSFVTAWKLDFRVDLLQTNDVIVELCVSDATSPQGGAPSKRIACANNVGRCLVYTGTSLSDDVTNPGQSFRRPQLGSAYNANYNKPSLIRLQLIRVSDNPDINMKNAVHSWVHTLKDTWHLGRQTSHFPVQTEPDSFFKPNLLHSKTSTTSESCIDE
jgi:hypothetical protein